MKHMQKDVVQCGLISLCHCADFGFSLDWNVYYMYTSMKTHITLSLIVTYIPVHSIFFLGFPSYPALHSQAEMELLPVLLVFEFFGHPVHLSGEGKSLKEPSGQAVWKNSFMILRTWQSRACSKNIVARKTLTFTVNTISRKSRFTSTNVSSTHSTTGADSVFMTSCGASSILYFIVNTFVGVWNYKISKSGETLFHFLGCSARIFWHVMNWITRTYWKSPYK